MAIWPLGRLAAGCVGVLMAALLVTVVILDCGARAVRFGMRPDSGVAPADRLESGTVAIENMRFNPPRIEVAGGDTVTWNFADGPIPHNVVGDGFQSDTTNSGSYSYQFFERGSFAYRCTLHGSMRGTVVFR